MNPTKTLNNLGQSLWLDNITRDLLNSGTLQRYINEWSMTGLTSNPTIFDLAISKSADYDGDIAQARLAGEDGGRYFLRTGSGGSDPRRRSAAAGLYPHRRRRWVGLARSVASSRV